jgi:hypothetical protein
MEDQFVWAERANDGITVQMISKSDTFFVIVEDNTGDFTLTAGKDGKLAMDMFYHPYLYRREVTTDAVAAA